MIAEPLSKLERDFSSNFEILAEIRLDSLKSKSIDQETLVRKLAENSKISYFNVFQRIYFEIAPVNSAISLVNALESLLGPDYLFLLI